MKGQVNSRLEAVVHVQIHAPARSSRRVAAVVDTGYSGFLTLPPALIRSLGLVRLGRTEGVLADGALVSFDLYGCEVLLDRRRIEIEVAEADTDPLLGMELLSGFELSIQVKSGGRVAVKRLSNL